MTNNNDVVPGKLNKRDSTKCSYRKLVQELIVVMELDSIRTRAVRSRKREQRVKHILNNYFLAHKI